ncbi:hypothetical protein CA265_21230 [Sphingobacteriaceae bacterium GW460-11-11-14-LB5]|nr:hypothetical protein CA265_21230 [Sphingobacteriaceae bacterium GW460-11-11-14-LB5]
MIKIFTKRNVPKRVLLLLLCLYLGLSAYAQTPSVKGVIKDAKETIVGATVIAQNVQTGIKTTTSSDKNGVFSFPRLAAGPYKFTINFIGYETKTVTGEVRDGGTFSLSVVLKESSTSLDKDVIVTGTGITRNKNSFTGVTATFSGETLKSIGNNNIIQSLRTLDPSFILMENNLAGANPNVLPVIEVRGKTSVPTATLKDQFGTDPNQPLFILDGFETTLQNIVDLDMNRVASVTILKDAASTALYGARASNGVVVVETIRPKAGQLQFTYSNDFRVESPDLSGYNMMNAAEKLQFEKLAGRYNYFVSNATYQQIGLDQIYNNHLAAVKRGVDTYWLNEPVQTGITENNSIYAQGGDQAFTYGVGLNYKTQSGAMKGSGRDTWSGNINLTYRKGKFNINNILYVRGYSSTDSPYGSFSNFVNANPYYIKDPSQRYLEVSNTSTYSELKVRNPLYDASLPNTSTAENLEVQNNFQLNYDISSDLQIRGGLQLVKGSVTAVSFLAPENSVFEEVGALQRGKYTNSKTDNFSYQGNMLLTYGKVFGGKHSVTANARAEINNRDFRAVGFVAEGFPEGSTGNPRFAYSYQSNAAPTASSSVYRTANATLSANYAYDMRYLFDFSYRLDGSTAFGKNKQFSPYWSSGIGWNLNREHFFANTRWINRLKLYANIGVTGNQNYGNITSVSVYNFNSSTNYNQFGQGVSLATLGNPDLKPQKTTQISAGLDYSLFNDRLFGYVSVYNKRTDPLVVAVDLPSSTGVFNYPLNVGILNNKGMEFKLNYAPIYNIEKRIVWVVGASGNLNKSKYDGFGNALRSLNKQQENNKTLLRFTDGYSPDDIWAAKSLGIDPATGREMFLRNDGQYTFDYSLGSVQAVGNTNPVIEGIFTSTFSFKGFNLGVYLRYRLGGDIFNTALYNKVENITYTNIASNQDKRALYDRWQKPGDVAQFKGISQTATTPMSSRFVQKENTISGESISMGYTFDRSAWLKKFGMRSLNLSALTNDIFRISSVKRERGIDYPFANTVSFTLRVSF